MRRSRGARLSRSWEQVAGGGAAALVTESGAVDSRFAHGDLGQFRLNMRLIPPDSVKAVINAALRAAGVNLTRGVFSEPGRVLVVEFRRNPGPLIIAGVLVAVIALFLILSWVLLRAIGGAAESLGETPLIWLAAGGIALFALSSGRTRAARKER